MPPAANPAPKIRPIFRALNRSEWRQWLADHFETETEIFLVFPLKSANEESISYNDAVEEALCFGWIDGVAGKLDDTHATRRFTPRRKGSAFSRPNIERLIWLEKQGLIHPKVLSAVQPIIRKPFVFPDDILAELRKDTVTWHNFQQFSEPYRRIRIAYIDAARQRPAEFQKRLANFVSKTKEGKRIMGYGGIEKYYQ